MNRTLGTSRLRTAIGTAALLVVCVMPATTVRAFPAVEHATAETVKTSRPRSTVINASGQTPQTFVIMGQVAYPSAYELRADTVRISELVRVAGGLSDHASGYARIVRSGRRSAQTMVMPGQDAEVYPGDIVVFHEGPAKQEPAPASTDAVTTVGYTTSSKQSQPAPVKDKFVQLAFINVYEHPVVVTFPAEVATVAHAVRALNQPASVAQSVRIVQTMPHRKPGTKDSSAEIQLTSGSILVFEKSALALDRLPETIAPPISCTATEAVDGTAETQGPKFIGQNAQADPAAPSQPVDSGTLASDPDETLDLLPPGDKPTQAVVPNLVDSDPASVEVLGPSSAAPKPVSTGTDSAELPLWPGVDTKTPQLDTAAVHQTTASPSATSTEPPQETVTVIPKEAAAAFPTGAHSAPPADSAGSFPVPPMPEPESPAGNVFPSSPFEGTTRPSSSVPLSPSLDTTAPSIEQEPPANEDKEAAIDDATAVEKREPNKARSLLRIKFPGTAGFAVPVDLFIVAVLGLVAAIIAVLTLVPGTQKLITSQFETEPQLVAVVEVETEAKTEAAAKPEEKSAIPVAAAAQVEPPAPRPVAASVDEQGLEALLRNEMPVVIEPFELKPNLTFYGRPSARGKAHRIDSGHEASMPHVYHPSREGSESPASQRDESIANATSGIPLAKSKGAGQRTPTRSTASQADLLDRALSNIQGVRLS